MAPFDAALKGSREIGFTILSITAVAGRRVHPAAVHGRRGRPACSANSPSSSRMAIALSAFVSLTLTPMLAAAARHAARAGDAAQPLRARRPRRCFDAACWRLRPRAAMGAAPSPADPGRHARHGGRVGLAVRSRCPRASSRSRISASSRSPPRPRQDISFPAMVELQKQAAEIVGADPRSIDVASAVGAGGPSSSLNTGRMFVNLKPRDERRAGRRGDPAAAQGACRAARHPGLHPAGPEPADRRALAKSQYQYTLQGIDQAELYRWSDTMMATLRASPLLQDVTSDLQLTSPQAHLDIDRDKAAELGVTSTRSARPSTAPSARARSRPSTRRRTTMP